jgi:hypothetical protein
MDQYSNYQSQPIPPPYSPPAATPDNTNMYVEAVVLTERMKASGVSNAVIYDMIVKKGIDHETAMKIIDTIAPARQQEKKDGKNDMIIGGLWFAGGLILTIGSYMMVSESGGRYLITYGPIIYGIFRFFKGVAKM